MAAPFHRAAKDTLRNISHTGSSLSSVITKLPDIYTNYVASNSQSVSQVEQTLRSLTYLLPGARFQDSELASESVHTFVQLLSIYHDRLLKQRAEFLSLSPTLSKHVTLPKPSHHAKYTSFWTSSSALYTKVATILKIAQYTELLWEMLAKRRGGERSRWRIVVFLESFKAACRLILLRLTQSRPVTTSPLPQREDFAPPPMDPQEDTKDLKDSKQAEELTLLDPMPYDAPSSYTDNGVPTPPVSESDKVPILPYSLHEPFSMPRTQHTLPSLPSPDSISNYLFTHILQADDVKPVALLVRQLQSYTGLAGEILYILRPLIYALLMQRLARRYGYEGTKWRKAWSPWFIGLAIEYISRQMVKKDLQCQSVWGANGLSRLEKEEMTARNWNLAWWAMRGAFYENVTKNLVRGVADKLKGKPVLDLVAGIVEDYEALWGGFEFSTATM